MLTSAYRSEAGWKEPYEPQDTSSGPQRGTTAAGAAVAVSGRALSVEERQAKAQQDIAAAKARQAAFAGQGTRQFTDIDIAQPEAPDFASLDSLGGSATDTFELQEGGAQSEDAISTDTFVMPPDGSNVSSGGGDDSQQSAFRSKRDEPLAASGRADIEAEAGDEQDAEPQAELQGQSRQASAPHQSSTVADDDTAGDREAEPAEDARPAPVSEADTSEAEDDRTADDTTPDPVYEPDTSKPLYAQGRSDLKPRADDEVNARAKAQAELQKQSKQTFDLKQPADTASEDDTADEAAEGDRPAPVYEPDTSKPLYAQGRADLKPRATDEQDARAKAQAELKQQSQQTFTPAVSASEAVAKMRAEGKLVSDSPSASTSAAPAATSAASDQSAPASPPQVGGRALPGEREAREKAMAELKRKSQEQQPVTGSSSDLAESRPKAPEQRQDQRLAAEQKPLSDQGRTQDLAKGLAEASMSAEPTRARAPPQLSPSGKRQPSPFQAQQAANSMSTTDSAATSLSPASQPQNPFQNLVTAFQGFFGGQAAASSPSLGSSFAPDQATLPALSTAQQAQISPADASAAQRMAASSQALAAGKGEARVRTEVPVKRYTDVALDGDVTEFVRERGLRAPLLLLAGLAASAAQTLEPLWPVSSCSRLPYGQRLASCKTMPNAWWRVAVAAHAYNAKLRCFLAVHITCKSKVTAESGNYWQDLMH